MGNEHMFDLVAVFIQLVVKEQGSPSRIAEYCINIVLQQDFHYQFRACDLHLYFTSVPLI